MGRTTSCLLFAGVLTLAAQVPLWGQSSADRGAGEPDEAASADQDELKREVAALRESVTRLEEKIDRLTERLADRSPAASPEFPPVRVRVHSESGKPLAGAVVTLTRTADGAPSVEVRETSGGDGLALDRVLPFGKYRYAVKTEIGWVAGGTVNVEFGKGAEVIVAAPPSSERSTVKIVSRLDERNDADLSGLRFGELRRYDSGNGFFLYPSPEPGEEPGDHESFATLGDGIERLGFSVRIGVTRAVSQPDGGTLTWRWSSEESERAFLVTGDAILPISGSGGRTSDPSGEHGYFADLSVDMRVAYVAFELEAPLMSPHSVTIPSGETTVWVIGAYGRPTGDVLNALGVEAEGDRQIWLPVELKERSAWIPRLLDASGWLADDIPGGIEHVLRKEATPAPLSTYEVVLEPPAE